MSGKELSLITPESAWPAKEFILAVRKRTNTLNVLFASILQLPINESGENFFPPLTRGQIPRLKRIPSFWLRSLVL